MLTHTHECTTNKMHISQDDNCNFLFLKPTITENVSLHRKLWTQKKVDELISKQFVQNKKYNQ